MNRYFSTSPIYSAPVANINRELGIIQGITVAQIGPAKGHNGFIDRTFLLQIIENAASRTAGVKARFGHPNMCSSALGSYLGRFKNYSYSGDQVKADLFLDETAKSTPNGDLYTYVLNMAETNPDMFGASLVFEIAESVFRQDDVEGQKVEKEYFRLKELRATDIVDEPAATDGLFSTDSFPALATQFLDENPEILEIIFSKPDSVIEFLSNYLNSTKMNLSDKIKENFAAFLATFSEKTDAAQPSNLKILNTLYDDIRHSYPEFIPDHSADSLPLQKAEILTSFITTMHDKMVEASAKSNRTTEAFDLLKEIHQDMITSSQLLTTELGKNKQELETATSRVEELTLQLSARPSIPLNVTDPAVSLANNQVKDETGKQILAAIPIDLKRKLSSNT
jgi:hypothetical protein